MNNNNKLFENKLYFGQNHDCISVKLNIEQKRISKFFQYLVLSEFCVEKFTYN